MLMAECKKHDIQVMFIESVCEDEALVLHNIMSVKLKSPDYKDMDPEKAVEDFKARIFHYREAYESITEENLTYIKLINVGSQVIINHIQGYLQSRIVYYLMNLHIAPRSIFFSRVRNKRDIFSYCLRLYPDAIAINLQQQRTTHQISLSLSLFISNLIS
jgi:6-phosphofructo-2-kinase/fructose-2,6-biphosphatase 2